MYTAWFEKNFLPHASSQRPLLLLQDGAAAHMSPELIDLAIANQVILLCFPPKLTHILQPCDVSLFRRMKAQLSHAMNSVKMMPTRKSTVWISKAKVPAILAEVMENAFTRTAVMDAFKDCGIHPLNRKVVKGEMVKTTVSFDRDPDEPWSAEQAMTTDHITSGPESTPGSESTHEPESTSGQEGTHEPESTHSDTPGSQLDEQAAMTQQPSNGGQDTGINDILLEDIELNMQVSEDPVEDDNQGISFTIETAASASPDAEVLVDSNEVGEAPRPCPPQLALNAVEQSLTPKKKKTYTEKYSAGIEDSEDPVYITWSILKRKVEQLQSPLIKAGIISPRLAEVLVSPPDPACHVMRIGRKKTAKARVLTSKEISNEIREHERKKKLAQEEKKKRVETREKNKRRAEEQRKEKAEVKLVQEKKKHAAQRIKRFEVWQRSLLRCKTFQVFTQRCEKVMTDARIYPLSEICLPTYHVGAIDEVSSFLLKNMVEYCELQPVATSAFGNCLPATGSYFLFGNEDHHVEMRVRIAAELALHADLYLDDDVLKQEMGHMPVTSRKETYAMFSDKYRPHQGSLLTSKDVQTLYEEETMSIVKPSTYMGIWQLHALSSVLGARVKSVYPGLGSVSKDLHRLIEPRQMNWQNVVHVMWTNSGNRDRSSWWEPNHFVPLLHHDQHTAIPVQVNTQWFCYVCFIRKFTQTQFQSILLAPHSNTFAIPFRLPAHRLPLRLGPV